MTRDLPLPFVRGLAFSRVKVERSRLRVEGLGAWSEQGHAISLRSMFTFSGKQTMQFFAVLILNTIITCHTY